jgi:hypothetical protein
MDEIWSDVGLKLIISILNRFLNGFQDIDARLNTI